MFRTLKELFSSSIFVFAFFLASNFTLAHFNSATGSKINLPQNDDFAAKHAKDLQNRLGLTNDQTSQVANILADYKNNVLNNNQNDPNTGNSINPQQAANDEIIKLLDESEKAAFAQMENEWWTNINQDIGAVNGRN
ncbi:MAG: hypothetical protein WBV81_10330 [Ignavibacteriaceae bacterium]